MNLNKEISAITRLTILTVAVLVMTIGFAVLGILNPALFSTKKIDPSLWQPRDIARDLAGHEQESLIRYGYDVLTKSPELIGPLADKIDKQYAGNLLTCQSCHLEGGTKPGAGSFAGVATRFPQFRGRENKMGTLAERIDGCMERSMNGQKIPHESLEMKGMLAYMEWLSEDVPEEKMDYYKGFTKVELPELAADPAKGKLVYQQHCQTCHMENGQGQRAGEGLYVYPPLWGENSYNHGAGMHRVITAAEFIKANMPYLQATKDKPILTDQEAYHVAAYINSFERPQKADPEVDFPDKNLKPVSTPYGPWVDPFTPEQHKYGPFQPIMAWYKQELGIEKKK
jgi:thiosulfate dehydrogenase